MAGLSELDYNRSPLPEAFQFAMAYPTVYQQALDQLEKNKQNRLKEQYNEEVVNDQSKRNLLERMRKQQEIAMDQYKEAKDYQDALTRTQLGQADLQQSAGTLKKALLPQEIQTGQQRLGHEAAIGNLLIRLDAIKQQSGLGGTGQIGFPVQPQSSGGGFNWQVSPQEQQARDIQSLGIMRQEQQQYPNDPALAKDIANRQASIAQPVNANNSPLTPQPPLRNGGITQGNPEYEAVMQALIDTPELRQKLVLGDQKLDSAEYNAMLKLMAQREIAAQRGTKETPLNSEQALMREIARLEASGELTHEEAQIERAKVFNRKTDAKIQPGNTVNPDVAPGVLQPKPQSIPYTPSNKNNVSDDDLIKKYLK